MVRQNPAHSFWDRLLAHFRSRDWDRCLQQLRPVLDSDEDALVPRLLAAGLHFAAGQPVLALLQYETLLPLAVGQGEFFAALAAQKRLDQLHPASVTHARRYEVLQRWFVSLGRAQRKSPGAPPGELTEPALLQLDSATFTLVMEECRIEPLDPEPRNLTDSAENVRVVLYGKAAWTLRGEGGIGLLEGQATGGQTIRVESGAGADARLEVASELPMEMLVFGPLALAALRGERITASPDLAPQAADPGERSAPDAAEPAATMAPASSPEPTSPGAAVAKPDEDADFPAEPEVSREAAAPIVEGAAPRAARPRRPLAAVSRPRPDPRFEPFVASFAPVQRRRETSVAINASSGVARLGLADTRVAPIGGRLSRLDGEQLELAFLRRDLRHLRTRLEGSCIGLQFNFVSEGAALQCTGRVRWTTTLGSGPDASELLIEIEFLALRATDRERLAEAGLKLPTTPPEPGSQKVA